ncbi:sporulation protein [Paenibacillus yonginensis]|uniref:Sporulation protein n=1 Tax=Paenibacillus yonginensis TaxID=1462996 RepID=A0A1B1N763_9BACL|nr:sporulation protein [Paenibacillus yonginensis]
MNRFAGVQGPDLEAGARVKMDAGELRGFFREIAAEHPLSDLQFICIGTDRSSGDALGPLTGSRLRAYGIEAVIGTMPDPCDAETLRVKLEQLPEGKIRIVIDACLGADSNVGFYLAARAPLKPAESVGLRLPPIGDYSIAAVVNRRSPKPYHTLQTTSLHLVMQMAEEIAAAAAAAFGRI